MTTPTPYAEQRARELANNIRLRPNSELGEYIEKLTAIIRENDELVKEVRQNELWDEKYLKLEAERDSYSEKAAALEVLKKCAEKLGNSDFVHIKGSNNHKTNPKWRVGSAYHCQDGDTLELAICLFAKKLFEKGGE
jgi:acetylornithine deacetylase/succinyl-diaminopimelate desuccinylase-like protein